MKPQLERANATRTRSAPAGPAERRRERSRTSWTDSSTRCDASRCRRPQTKPARLVGPKVRRRDYRAVSSRAPRSMREDPERFAATVFVDVSADRTEPADRALPAKSRLITGRPEDANLGCRPADRSRRARGSLFVGIRPDGEDDCTHALLGVHETMCFGRLLHR